MQWGRSKKAERKAEDAAVCAEASRWLHEVVADTERPEVEGTVVVLAQSNTDAA